MNLQAKLKKINRIVQNLYRKAQQISKNLENWKFFIKSSELLTKVKRIMHIYFVKKYV